MDYSRGAEMQQHPTNPNPSTDSYLHFYNPQQPSYPHYPFYPHQSQNPNPNPQTSLKHHEISSTQYEAGLGLAPQPLGLDSYAAMASYPPTHVAYEAQAAVAYAHQPPQMGLMAAAAYYQDPNATTQNWTMNDAIRHFGADPVGYAAAIKSLNKKSIVPSSSNSVLMNNWINQPLANGFIQRTPNKTKVIQSMWCEVCKIDCNSQDVLNRHKMGKKHQKNVQKLQESMKGSNAPSSTTLLKTSTATNNRILPGQMGSHIGGQMIMGTSTVDVGDDLETKRQKLMEGGATTDSVRFCTICNVACNSQVVFSYHLAGKKHAAQVKQISSLALVYLECFL
ncbi:hypothetical protein HHK36_030120 [Tetracentron sinense]|uniref:U1-type domain-containing protein n=1 Tax=Tetracentron sinense TaxID=13715 RepID=A0A834YAV7_TETSI|nr:hypothetical protein HHK36_030120 [Tetracentron sinense]